MSIIIVDDNTTNLIVIEKILKAAGYSDLLMASSAAELYRIIEIDSETPVVSIDLILMDVMMPEIDGVAACRRIQQVELLRDIPIIFVTAMGNSDKLAEALDAGATDYVTKPINKVELLARIRSALRLKFEKDWHKENDKRIKYELKLAQQVQRNVLSPPIINDNLEIHAIYQPSFELTGDFYAWYPISKDKYGIILLDMMGHGISSSLVCMYISSVLQDTITRISGPKQVIHELNRYMNQLYMTDALMNYYFTAIYLVLDTKKKSIEYVNAGHPPGIVYIGNKVEHMDKGCCAIGFFDKIDITEGIIRYEDTAKIVLYTDGLIDSNEVDRKDNIDKFVGSLKKYGKLTLDEFAAKFIPDENNGGQQDDMCLLMITTK
jgi:sigma-B regulation protein RsbU (phosphoserine phosphatase)